MDDYPWFKMYNDTPFDPKIRRLEPALRWGWVTILAVASKSRNWTEHHGDLLVAKNTPATIADLADAASIDEGSMSRLCHVLCHADMMQSVSREYGDEVLHVVRFADRNHRKSSDLPEATRARKRKSRAEQKDAESGVGHADVTQMSRDKIKEVRGKSNNTLSSSVKDGKKHTDYTPEFESFWSVYPLHKSKGKAFRCWQALLKKNWTPDELIMAATRYAKECRRKGTIPKYILHGATFLGPDKHFEDFLGDAPVEESPNSYIPMV